MNRVAKFALPVFVPIFVLIGGVNPVAAAPKPTVEHITFQDSPFFLDLTDPLGSAQCDVQAVGYDTGIANVITFVDESGNVTRQILIQSIESVLTNPENGKSIVFRTGSIFKDTFTWNPDGSLTIETQFSGLNILYKGESVIALAGRATSTALVRFDRHGNVELIDFVEDFTPHQAHAFPLFCELLA